MAELVSRRVAVIAVPGSTPAALAAKAATQTIPIVFVAGVDPIEIGLVASLARPGGNITGVALLQTDIATKRLDLVHQLIPAALTIGLLRNPARLMKTYALQMEVLRRLRNGGQQYVRVEHVYITGGQAFIGNVQSTDRRSEK